MNFWIKVTVIGLLTTFLAACGGSLPTKDKITAGTGILAIPKSYYSEQSFDSGWMMEVIIEDSSGNRVGKPIKLTRAAGKNFAFASNLEPGHYSVAKGRLVTTGENAVGAERDYQDFGKSGIPFKIEANSISVLPIIFATKTKSAGVDAASTGTDFEWLRGELKDDYMKIMEKKNTLDWDVIWP